MATSCSHPQAEMLKHQHYQWLLQTAQEEKAAAVKEAEGDFTAAISLYLKGGLPARAAQVRADILAQDLQADPLLLLLVFQIMVWSARPDSPAKIMQDVVGVSISGCHTYLHYARVLHFFIQLPMTIISFLECYPSSFMVSVCRWS